MISLGANLLSSSSNCRVSSNYQCDYAKLAAIGMAHLGSFPSFVS